jgi:hypothetical protein
MGKESQPKMPVTEPALATQTTDAAPHVRPTPKQVDKIAAGGFVPDLQTDDRTARMSLGGTYSHRVIVANDGAAPKGTKYAWSHAVIGAPNRAVGKPDLEGPTTSWPFLLRGVGEYRVLSKVQYGAAKGTQDEALTAMKVVVGKPTAHHTELETEKDNKRRPFAGNMLVGEDLVLTTQLDDLRGADVEPLEDVRAHVVVPGLTFKSVKALTHGLYEIRLHAPHAGGALGHVAALPYDTKLGDTPVHTIRTDISKADEPNTNPDARPHDFAAAKSWLKSNYDLMFNEMRTANTALSMQTQVNDPPPKHPDWVNFIVGCATAALGGFAAGMALGVAKHLLNGASEPAVEGLKSFLEQGLTAAVTASFKKEEIENSAPHVSFKRLHESAIHKKQNELEKFYFANVLIPQLDAMEQAERGAGFRKAMDLDHAMKAEISNAAKLQYDESFEQWVKFVTKGQLGERANPGQSDGETGTDMSSQLQSWVHKAGVISIYLHDHDPKSPAIIRQAHMPGFNEALRERIAKYKVKDLPFAVRVLGGRAGSTYTHVIARNENREYWVLDMHSFLERKSGGSAVEGAKQILEHEIGNEQITPES